MLVSGSVNYGACHLPRRSEPQKGCGQLDEGLADETEDPGPSAKKGKVEKGLIGEPEYLARHVGSTLSLFFVCANVDPVQSQP